MNKVKIGGFSLTLSMLLLVTGCSAVSSVTSIFDKKNKDDNGQVTVLPQDREKIHTQTDPKLYTSQELKKGVIKGDWVIETVNGHEAVGEEMPFLKFEPKEFRVYGNNGCNSLTANYEYNPADSTIRFSNAAATMRLCATPGITDYEIMQAMDRTRFYSWELNDTDYEVSFFDENHTQVLTMMHRNFSFLNGTWQVVAIGTEPIDNPDMKLVIDVDEGKLHGNTGCNIINGNMEIDMTRANSISFSSIITTRMACHEPENETRFIVALEEASTAKALSKTKVILVNSNGDAVLTLERQNI